MVIPNTEKNIDYIAVQECKLCNTESNKHKAFIRHLAAIHDCDATHVPFTASLTKNNKRKLFQTKFKEFRTPKKVWKVFLINASFAVYFLQVNKPERDTQKMFVTFQIQMVLISMHYQRVKSEKS